MSPGEWLPLVVGTIWYGGGMYLLARIRAADDRARGQ